MYWIWHILIGVSAGYIGSLSTKGLNSFIANIVSGIIGGMVGGWMFRFMTINSSNMPGSLITSATGAIILLLCTNVFTTQKR